MKENQIEIYIPLYHGTSAILQPDVDELKPFANNANKINAVFATSYFFKALACALLSKRNLQNIIIGPGSYSYLYDNRTKTMILHPMFQWDDGVPTYVYTLDKTNFFKLLLNKKVKNEYISQSPVKITSVDVITPESIQRNNVKLYTAKSVNILKDLRYLGANSKYPIRPEILNNLCQKIV